jgi:hypothetical protein
MGPGAVVIKLDTLWRRGGGGDAWKVTRVGIDGKGQRTVTVQLVLKNGRESEHKWIMRELSFRRVFDPV